VEMPDLGISHLPGRQSDGVSRCFESRPRRFAKKAIESRLRRLRDRVVLALFAASEPVEDDEDILIVLDGFGCRKEREYNAIAEASKPRFDRLFRESPWTTLEASGNAVGLPAGQMGNSEVGHLNIGAGRIVDQDIVRISRAIERDELLKNLVLIDAVKK